MNLISKMRISHKISALMVGLTTGFIFIGVAYYSQTTISQSARKIEHNAFTYQQMLAELKQLEMSLRFQSKQVEWVPSDVAKEQAEALDDDITDKISKVFSLQKSRVYAKHLETIIEEYNYSLAKKIGAVSNLRSRDTLELKREIETSLTKIERDLEGKTSTSTAENLAKVRLSIVSHLNMANYASKKEIEENSRNFYKSWKDDPQLGSLTSQQREHKKSVEKLTSQVFSLVEDLFTANKILDSSENNLTDLISVMQIEAQQLSDAVVEDHSNSYQTTQAIVTAVIFLVAIGATVGIYLIYKSIVFPMAHMQNVINRINNGKSKARVKILSNDEMADLGTAFNKLFDERIKYLEGQSTENDQLNNSIIALIQALGAIANKDLTIKVPVSADITGTISDAVNLLTTETANTLHAVKAVSHEVNRTSDILQDQSKRVMQFAESERMQIVATTKALKVLASAMTEVASQSEKADKSATQAILSTHAAKRAVTETVSGIRDIRETISETEKRTKRLGDRSQEISGIVNLINAIAERTHILALNASMHAASAGEAGKGFAVVAEEVQRLAESARESTDEISNMVNNIKVETADTVTIMNKLISQVAEGSKLAEQAGEAMESTETATRELVTTVKHIASQAIQQATVANRVKDRAAIIRNFTDKSEKQLAEQHIYTENLRKYAESLVAGVNVFKLPQDSIPAIAKTSDNASNVSPLKSAV